MEYFLIAIFTIFMLPVLVGWWHGKNHINPNTLRGKAYYSRKD
jgi:hypothetical protein